MPPPLDQLFSPLVPPDFHRRECEHQSGRIFLITGSSSGLGVELPKILYGLNATVYIASRSLENINTAMETIKRQIRTKTGPLESLKLDLEKPPLDRSVRPRIPL